MIGELHLATKKSTDFDPNFNNDDEKNATTNVKSRILKMKGMRKPNVSIRRSNRQSFGTGLTEPRRSTVITSVVNRDFDHIDAAKQRWARNAIVAKTPNSVRSSKTIYPKNTIETPAESKNEPRHKKFESNSLPCSEKSNLAIINIEDNPLNTHQVGFNSLLLGLNDNSSDDSSSESATDSSYN